MILIEVVCCSLEECIAAEEAGADRIELCVSLELDGLTPPVELLEAAKARVGIPIVTMVRPRAGDFVYSPPELAVMREDAKRLLDAGADGLVLGCLSADGTVDAGGCGSVVAEIPGVEFVFHKAIDASADVMASALAIESMGFKRVLTSGGARTALEGADVLKRLMRETKLEVMAGGGVRAHNVREVVERSGVTQVHFGAFKGVDNRVRNGVKEILAVRAELDSLGE